MVSARPPKAFRLNPIAALQCSNFPSLCCVVYRKFLFFDPYQNFGDGLLDRCFMFTNPTRYIIKPQVCRLGPEPL